MALYPEKYIVPLTYLGKRNVDTRVIVLTYVYHLHQK